LTARLTEKLPRFMGGAVVMAATVRRAASRGQGSSAGAADAEDLILDAA